MNSDELIQATANIAAAFLTKSVIDREDLPSFLKEIYDALVALPFQSGSTTDLEVALSRSGFDGARSGQAEMAEGPGRLDPKSTLAENRSFGEPKGVMQEPAVPIDSSITDEFIISLEDGGRYRSLRRHLMAKYGMTPDDYRRKWGLPPDYPMVAPSYARERSNVAKRIGLGRPRLPLDMMDAHISRSRPGRVTK